MVSNTIVQKFEQIKKEVKTGDYLTLAKMLGLDTSAAARMRFIRKDPGAVNAMETLIENRKDLIEEYQSQNAES